MKARSVIALFAFAVLLPFAALASDYLGEFRFAFTNSTYGSSGSLVLGVSHIGDSHFLVSGRAEKTSPAPTETVPVYGNAEIIDGSIALTIAFVGDEGTESWRATLSPDSLSGPFTGIGLYDNQMEVTEGTMSLLR